LVHDIEEEAGEWNIMMKDLDEKKVVNHHKTMRTVSESNKTLLRQPLKKDKTNLYSPRLLLQNEGSLGQDTMQNNELSFESH
jgi:hypothetical protein